MEVYNLKSKKTLILFFALAMVATACSSAAVPCDEVEITTGENGLPDLDGCEFTFAVENAYYLSITLTLKLAKQWVGITMYLTIWVN